MKLTEQQHKLLEFVTEKHGKQVRKYTGEPYVSHLISVAKIASEHVEGAIEIALCHDIFEDTNCTYDELSNFLITIGYSKLEAEGVCYGTIELTDQYTHENYPNKNRNQRNSMEAQRLGHTSYIVQSIKYADLIDNTSSIVEHDKGFAKVYLKEKIRILDYMRGGNIELLVKCCYTLQKALNELINEK
jgi:(p)ppGpp synthase/HD superfamily hydrolase